MLILSNIALYFFDHFILYLRDEATYSSQEVFAQEPIQSDQESRSRSGATARCPPAATVGQTSPGSAGSRFGFPPSPTQETHPKIVCASGVSVGHAGFGFLSSLGGP